MITKVYKIEDVNSFLAICQNDVDGVTTECECESEDDAIQCAEAAMINHLEQLRKE